MPISVAKVNLHHITSNEKPITSLVNGDCLRENI